MWLVLCHSEDLAAIWACRELRSHGLEPVELVTADLLACSLRSVHWLDSTDVGFSFRLADNREITHDSARGVLNRLTALPSPQLAVARESDRAYAMEEVAALTLSWLSAFRSRVINRPTPLGLSGAIRHPAEWLRLAAIAGLPTVRSQFGSDLHDGGRTTSVWPLETVIVLDQDVFGAQAPSEIKDGARRLAELAETSLLGVDFACGQAGKWVFVNATPLPDLRGGGSPLIDALLSALAGEEGGES